MENDKGSGGVDAASEIDSNEIKMEIELGKVEAVDFRKSACVICEGWPSLFFVLEAHGFHVECIQVTEEEVCCWERFVDRDRFTKLSPNTFAEAVVPDVDSYWVQGTTNFVKSVVPLLKGKLYTIVEPGSRRHKFERGFGTSSTVTHAHSGGITLSRWGIHTTADIDSHWKRGSSVRRTLRHVLDHTEKGVMWGNLEEGSWTEKGRKRKRDQPGGRVFTEDSRVTPGSRLVTVQTYCVRQPGRNIRRLLNPRELLDVYDVQTYLQKDIIGLDRVARNGLLDTIVEAAPEKVLYGIVQGVKVGALLVPTEDIETKKREEIEEDYPAFTWMKEEEAAEMNDEKAARNDDAAIATDQWDDYLNRSFDPAKQWKALEKSFDVTDKWRANDGSVVVGKTGHIKEKQRLFEILRERSVLRFGMNVSRSWRRYMREKYPGKMTAAEEDHGEPIWLGCVGISRRRPKGWREMLGSYLGSRERMKDFLRDVEVGVEAIERACHSSFWDWTEGSTLFYWRWAPEFRKEARDGTKTFVTGNLPEYKSAQQWPSEPKARQMMALKLLKVIDRAYIAWGQVNSLTGCFAVPKGEEDIRMVYDATKCGLNEKLWAPNFLLPTIDTTLRQVLHDAWFGDIDLGEMFLNFPLDEELRKFTGVDVTKLRKELVERGILSKDEESREGRIFLRWVRCLMGLRSSPYNANRAMGWVEDVIRGDPSCVYNPFRWGDVILNLPGLEDYDPSLPKVYRWDEEMERLASNFETYVDDIRTSGATEGSCVDASRRVASLCNYFGVQDAARKRRFPSMRPGVWCGAKTSADGTGLYTSTTQEKWDKGKGLVSGWRKEVAENGNMLDRKGLEKGRGFLVHLSRTYPMMVPFMKGIHHTLESWRGGRNKDGWKFSTSDWKEMAEELYGTGKLDWKDFKNQTVEGATSAAPATVVGVERLVRDLESLNQLMKSEKPPLRLVRGNRLGHAIYGFGDASGTGFGSSWEVDKQVNYRFGVWGRDNVDKSSNYRELRNLVETLEEIAQKQGLHGVEIYFFTDNSTAEAAFHKGSSTSELLHELVTRLRLLEMERGCKIHLIHVSGERMKRQGSDGLSRGSLLEGVMSGKSMLSFVPIHQTALQGGKGVLEKWIESWLLDGNEKLETLHPRDWYVRGHDMSGGQIDRAGLYRPTYRSGKFLWAPPPAVAEAALEEIRKARVKRTSSTHVFVCPRLMTPVWKAHLHRAADLILEIPAGCSIWPSDKFEPLILGIFFPFIKHRPWQLRRSNALLGLENQLRGMWKDGRDDQGVILRKFRTFTGTLDSMSPGLVWKMLQSFTPLEVSCEGGHKRGRSSMEEKEGFESIHGGKRR